MKKGNLSNNFRPLEFACKCGCGQMIIIPELVNSVQFIRNLIGLPIRITSANRCIKHNKTVGGEEDSLHLVGWACDIAFPNTTNVQFEEIVKKIDQAHKNGDIKGGLGIYPESLFVHIDIGRYRKWIL